MIFRMLYLAFCMFMVAAPFYAVNDSCISINEAEWAKITKDKNYTETYKDFETKEKKTEHSIIKNPGFELGGLIYIFYFLVAGAILFLIVKILLNINSSPVISMDNGRVYTLAEVEEKMLEIDLDKILNDALTAGDFRLALRINFLIIIKLLSISGRIVWTKEKTNWEYFNEIKDEATAVKFKDIVTPFETIWYGEYPLTEQQFNRLSLTYESFKKQLGK